MPSPKEVEKLQSYEAQTVLKNFSFSKRCKYRSIQDTLNGCSSDEIDLIMGLLRFDPNLRISAEEALKHPYFNEVRQMHPPLEKYSS